MSKTEPIRLLIAERRSIVREGICNLVEGVDDVELAAAAADSRETLSLARQLRPDVVLLGTSVQGRGFFDTLRRIRAARPEVPVIVLGGHRESTHAERARSLGASGYLSDDIAFDDLLAAIHAVYAGREYPRRAAGETLDRLSSEPCDKPRHTQLSNREYEVLCLMGSGKGISAIAPELGLSAKTVSTYRSRLQRKLKLGSSAEIIRYAIEHKLAPTRWDSDPCA